MDVTHVDVRDLDYTWFENVKAYFDRESNTYFFPRPSAERLGELDETGLDYLLIDGHVRAEAAQIEVDGVVLDVWGVGITQLVVRPAKQPDSLPAASASPVHHPE